MIQSEIDFYEVLGLSENATVNEIRQAYRKLAIIWHPVSIYRLCKYRIKIQIEKKKLNKNLKKFLKQTQY